MSAGLYGVQWTSLFLDFFFFLFSLDCEGHAKFVVATKAGLVRKSFSGSTYCTGTCTGTGFLQPSSIVFATESEGKSLLRGAIMTAIQFKTFPPGTQTKEILTGVN